MHLKDLGYFKTEHFEYIENTKAYYISKLKYTAVIYVKNDEPELLPNGNIRKDSIYKRIDIKEIVEPLAEGETIELFDIYIGKTKNFKTRLIVSKLTEECKSTRE